MSILNFLCTNGSLESKRPILYRMRFVLSPLRYRENKEQSSSYTSSSIRMDVKTWFTFNSYHIVKDLLPQYNFMRSLYYFLHVDEILTWVIFRILPKSLQFFPFFGRNHIKINFIKVSDL